jgi:hypothetical protein
MDGHGWRTDPKRLTCNKRVAFGLTGKVTGAPSSLLFLPAADNGQWADCFCFALITWDLALIYNHSQASFKIQKAFIYIKNSHTSLEYLTN